MIKYIWLITILCITSVAKSAETIEIYGLIVKREIGAQKKFILSHENKKKQTIKITYLGHGYGKKRLKYKFKIQKQTEGEKEEIFTYYLREGDIINFKYFNYILIVFEKKMWFKHITY